MKKIRVLLLAGGQSEEHEVSINSARSVLQALPADRFEVTSIVISREGRWLPAPDSARALERGSAATGGELVLHQAASAEAFDVVFPILHGPNGEDGTIQGMLKLAGIPFVGSSVLGSAVSMDKIMTKAVLATHGIPQVPYQLVTRHEFTNDPEDAISSLMALGFPLFVKPANLGSSVGISKARDVTELRAALRLAFELDRRVIVEVAAGGAPAHGTGSIPAHGTGSIPAHGTGSIPAHGTGSIPAHGTGSGKPREIEVGILGNDDPQASPVGELTFESDFYDYDTKYTEGRAEMHIPANIPPGVSDQARALAIQAFKALDCAGLSRIDFFYCQDGSLYLNEVNTMPGFTKTSMYPQLWQAAGVGYGELVSRLVELALERR
jgi:D-alanine-D-alanine ligase